MLSKELALLLFLPALLAGALFPCYIGYVRGAIGLDSRMERLRGWIYLGCANATYLALISVAILRDFYVAFSSLGIFVYFFIIVVGSILFGSCIKWLLGVLLLPLDDDNLRVIGLTGVGAVFLSACVVFAEEFIRLLPRGGMSVPQFVLVAYLSIVFIISERTARICFRQSLDIRLETPESRQLLSLSSRKFIRLIAETGAKTLRELAISNTKTDAFTALWWSIPFFFASGGTIYADGLSQGYLGKLLSQFGLLDSAQHSLRVIGIISNPILAAWSVIVVYMFLTTREIQTSGT